MFYAMRCIWLMVHEDRSRVDRKTRREQDTSKTGKEENSGGEDYFLVSGKSTKMSTKCIVRKKRH